jgi:hypothetical protein
MGIFVGNMSPSMHPKIKKNSPVQIKSFQTVQGQLFGISQSKANSWIQYLMPILSSALDCTLVDLQ